METGSFSGSYIHFELVRGSAILSFRLLFLHFQSPWERGYPWLATLFATQLLLLPWILVLHARDLHTSGSISVLAAVATAVILTMTTILTW